MVLLAITVCLQKPRDTGAQTNLKTYRVVDFTSIECEIHTS